MPLLTMVEKRMKGKLQQKLVKWCLLNTLLSEQVKDQALLNAYLIKATTMPEMEVRSQKKPIYTCLQAIVRTSNTMSLSSCMVLAAMKMNGE